MDEGLLNRLLWSLPAVFSSFVSVIFMVALCNRETIYIFMLWFVLLLLLSSFFFPRLISAASRPKFTILWGPVEDILLLNKFFSDCRYVP